MVEATEPPRSTAATERAERERVYRERIGEEVPGGFRLESLLGSGGMAAVYAATRPDGSRVALKILHREVVRDTMVSERFFREADVAGRVGHPGCVRVEGEGTTASGEPFLVMELLEGETVRDFWKRVGRRVPVDDALRIAEGMLDCLAACHAAGIIHRDLKPANVFITKDDRIKLLDFGVAQVREAAGEVTRAGTALGTPSYMPPEQAMGLVDQLDGRADVFSVGALLHALTTGRRIHRARTENEALVMAATVPVPSVARAAPDLPLGVVRVIDKALAWDRRNRFADAREMQEAVRAAREALTRPISTAPLAATPAADERPDERATELIELFKLVDRLLPNVRQLGWDHPLTERALRTVFEAWGGALSRDPAFGRLTVWPYSFVAFGQTVWEPTPPSDTVPYHLFACGVRKIEVRPGVTQAELREMFGLFLLDPARDLPPEDDLAAAFWERDLANVRWETVLGFVAGDAASREAFYDEADRLEELARAEVERLEADAMALSTDPRALDAPGGSFPLELEAAVKSAFAAELTVSHDAWNERYVDALVEGYIDAAMARDAPLVLASLRRSACDLLVSDRMDVVVSLHRAMRDRLVARVAGEDLIKLAAAVSNALFGGEALELALAELKRRPDRVPMFEPALAQLATRDLPIVLAALEGAEDELADALLRYVERVLTGHENEIGEAARRYAPRASVAVVSMLARAGTPAAREVLARLASGEDLELAVEAKIHAAGGPDRAHAELAGMLESPSAFARMAALRALSRHGLKGAFPTVARQARAASFDELGTDERREILRTLVALSSDHGESLVLEIAKRSGVFTSDAREGSRVVALEVLGETSTSTSVESELREIGQARWGISDETRTAASEASAKIRARAIGGSTPPKAGATKSAPPKEAP